MQVADIAVTIIYIWLIIFKIISNPLKHANITDCTVGVYIVEIYM